MIAALAEVTGDMAGHNKWSKIRHRKAVVDSRRSKVWTKCAKAIIVAAKNGGPDPADNLSLRYAIDEARYANMPRDTIERAVKKGAGELGTQNFETVRYEGFGPGGVAFIVEALTDNRTRTASDLRVAFSKYGGNLGTTGCATMNFESRGQIVIRAVSGDGDRLMNAAVDCGASDVVEPDDGAGEDAVWVVATPPTEFLRVKDTMAAAGFEAVDASISWVPLITVVVTGDIAKNVLKLVDLLEDNDDVQKVAANFEIPESELAELE